MSGAVKGQMRQSEGGFTLVEVVVAIVILGIVGAAATHLVIRLSSTREATIRYEQRSLVARMAAEKVWDLFAQSSDHLPEQCLERTAEPPSPGSFEPLDVNYSIAFQCEKYAENGQVSDLLYRVYVWVSRSTDGELVAEFPMLALIGGY